MNRTPRVLALLALSAALIAAGCGGDDDEETTASPTTTAVDATTPTVGTLTKDEFIRQADQICAAGDEEIEAAAAQFGDQAPQDQELTAFTEDVVIPSIQAQHDAIAALPVPEGEEDAVEELLSKLQTALDELAEDPEQLSTGGQSFDEVNQLADEFGLTNCGGSAE